MQLGSKQAYPEAPVGATLAGGCAVSLSRICSRTLYLIVRSAAHPEAPVGAALTSSKPARQQHRAGGSADALQQHTRHMFSVVRHVEGSTLRCIALYTGANPHCISLLHCSTPPLHCTALACCRLTACIHCCSQLQLSFWNKTSSSRLNASCSARTAASTTSWHW